MNYALVTMILSIIVTIIAIAKGLLMLMIPAMFLAVLALFLIHYGD